MGTPDFPSLLLHPGVFLEGWRGLLFRFCSRLLKTSVQPCTQLQTLEGTAPRSYKASSTVPLHATSLDLKPRVGRRQELISEWMTGKKGRKMKAGESPFHGLHSCSVLVIQGFCCLFNQQAQSTGCSPMICFRHLTPPLKNSCFSTSAAPKTYKRRFLLHIS